MGRPESFATITALVIAVCRLFFYCTDTVTSCPGVTTTLFVREASLMESARLRNGSAIITGKSTLPSVALMADEGALVLVPAVKWNTLFSPVSPLKVPLSVMVLRSPGESVPRAQRLLALGAGSADSNLKPKRAEGERRTPGMGWLALEETVSFICMS